MKTTKNKGKRILYPLFFILLSAVIVFNGIRILNNERKGNHVRAYKVEGGWGYRISVNGKVFIDQSFIPVLQGKKPFPTRSSARETGKMVLERLENRQPYHVTMDDLKTLDLAE